MERNYNYLADYVKFNRIVFIIFILGAYLAYNTLDVDGIGGGVGIYGGVFKITVLSQVFDIVLFITGGIISILTCFVPYNYKSYDDSKSMKFILENDNKDEIKGDKNYRFFMSNFKDYYNKKLLYSYSYNDLYKKSNSGFYIWIITKIKNLID